MSCTLPEHTRGHTCTCHTHVRHARAFLVLCGHAPWPWQQDSAAWNTEMSWRLQAVPSARLVVEEAGDMGHPFPQIKYLGHQ